MTLRFKTIFTDNWPYILTAYKDFLSSPGTQAANEDLLLRFLEVGVKIGEKLAQMKPNGFVEIGCGMAIPSLTLAKLGYTNGIAIDIDPKIIAYAKDIRDHLGCDLKFECADIFENRPKLKKGDFVIAEKPTSYKRNNLEVEHSIKNWCTIEGHNLVLVPSFLRTDTRDTYNEKCAHYEKKLRQSGYRVENKQIEEKLPFRWVIAIK